MSEQTTDRIIIFTTWAMLALLVVIPMIMLF